VPQVPQAFDLHFTPTGASWMNMVEVWFGVPINQPVRRGNFEKKCYNLRHEDKMTIQIKKIYRDLNPSMLGDQVRGLLQKQRIIVVETESQMYALLSGDTQSLTTLVLKTPAEQEKDQMECGSVHILGSPQGETKMLLDVDETLFAEEKLSAFQGDLDFFLGSYEVKW
jgi:hypothetical protein